MEKRTQQNPLGAVEKESFSRPYFTKLPKNSSFGLWAGFFSIFFFAYMGTSGVFIDGISFPKYFIAIAIVIWLSLVVCFVACIIYGRKKITLRRPVGYLYARAFMLLIMGFLICFLIYSLTMILVASDEVTRVYPLQGALVTGWFIVLLAGGVAAYVWMLKRMQQRIVDGHFRPGGSGFFGDFGWKKKIPAVSAAAFAITMILIPISQILSKAGVGIEWNNSYWPVEILLATVFICVFLFLFAYILAVTSIQIYYVKRFGIESTPALTIPGNDLTK